MALIGLNILSGNFSHNNVSHGGGGGRHWERPRRHWDDDDNCRRTKRDGCGRGHRDNGCD